MARSGSKYHDRRMIPARFAYVSQRSTCYLHMRFLLIFQEVESISKTCNPLNTMEGFWSLLQSWLHPHRGISQAKLLLSLGFFEFVHTIRKRGKALLHVLIELLVT